MAVLTIHTIAGLCNNSIRTKIFRGMHDQVATILELHSVESIHLVQIQTGRHPMIGWRLFVCGAPWLTHRINRFFRQSHYYSHYNEIERPIVFPFEMHTILRIYLDE